MFSSDQYELLDFGAGRKLERFGGYVVDRPVPAAEHAAPRAYADLWNGANARFERRDAQHGDWKCRTPPPHDWRTCCGQVQFELRLADSGQVGVFAEQAPNWKWIAQQVAAANRPLKVLNLFAYTGGSTLAAAAAGAQVVHVDASKSAVAWARRNAELSGLADAPIRWIVEDAPRFVERELRRGNAYDAVILDPPSYGHGPKGEVWQVAEHLPPLLAACAALTASSRAFMLLTCHTAGFGPDELAALLADNLGANRGGAVHSAALTVSCANGRQLDSGAVARWPVR